MNYKMKHVEIEKSSANKKKMHGCIYGGLEHN